MKYLVQMFRFPDGYDGTVVLRKWRANASHRTFRRIVEREARAWGRVTRIQHIGRRAALLHIQLPAGGADAVLLAVTK